MLTQAVAQAVNETLGGSARGRGRKAGKAGAGARRTVANEELLRAISQGGAAGLRMEEIGKSMNVSTKSLVRPMKALLAAKKVKRAGQARGTTYRAA